MEKLTKTKPVDIGRSFFSGRKTKTSAEHIWDNNPIKLADDKGKKKEKEISSGEEVEVLVKGNG